ncbi:MAG: type II secretion system F family protein [Candidatus Omnitrophota bacterium]
MARFYYSARDSAGQKLSGYEEAHSQDELITRLQAKGLIVISVVNESEGGKVKVAGLTAKNKGRHKFRHYGINSDDLVVFSRQLATLLGAGVTILKSLDIISQQVGSHKFYNVIIKLERDMEAGLTFHEALGQHPAIFSELWVNLVESGEASGNLAGILNRLAGYLERRASFKKKIVSSLIYPVILMSAGLGALLFLTIKIIPTFAELFKGFGAELPRFTMMLVAVSSFIRKYILFMLLTAVTISFLFRAYIKTREGRKRFEEFQLHLPVFGEFFRALTVERFSSEMSTLIESGVPLLYSLEITEHSVGNTVMSGIVHQIKEDVREGKPLNYTLGKSGFFEPMVVQMIAVGEEIGELPQMFKRVNTFYQEYTETFLARFTTIFEPMMLVFMGLVIGIMVLGMFMPIFQIATLGTSSR